MIAKRSVPKLMHDHFEQFKEMAAEYCLSDKEFEYCITMYQGYLYQLKTLAEAREFLRKLLKRKRREVGMAYFEALIDLGLHQ